MFDKKVFIIAEAGVNHNGKLNTALRMVDAAAGAKVDAIKFQVFIPERLASRKARKAAYQRKAAANKNNKQLDMLKNLVLSKKDFGIVKKYCDRKNILFLATPFDFESANFIEEMVPIYKLSSTDVNNTVFLEYVAKKNKPIILSTGMSTLKEVKKAVNIITGQQHKINRCAYPPLSLLHCTTSYPCDLKDVNLRAMATLKKTFGLCTGYSDHTSGIYISIAAVALGAKIIEKHFTLDKKMVGPDHNFSLEPRELKHLVQAVRSVEIAMGSFDKRPTAKELNMIRVARKSLVLSEDLRKGDVIKREILSIKRPGYGIPPDRYLHVIGRRLIVDKKADDILKWDDIEQHARPGWIKS